MELSNEFTVSMPAERAFEVLTDVERIAPCLPGAELQDVKGDEYLGVVKVKVGPITAQYKGVARFLEKDAAARRAVLRAEGRDTRGQGNASATVTATLEPAGDGTKVSVVTDLTITGKVAQFGRGVLADVSNKLLGQFVQSLEETVAAEAAGGGSAGAAASTTASAAASAARQGSTDGTEHAPAGGAASEPATVGRSTSGSGGSSHSSGRRTAGSAEPAGVEAESAESTGGAAAGSAGGARATANGAATVGSDAEGSESNGSARPADATSRTPSTASSVASTPVSEAEDVTGERPAPTRRPSAEPVDLLELAGPSVLKRAAPVVGVALLLFVLAWLWFRLRGSSSQD